MTVSVLVPWRPGDPHREAAWSFLRPRWEALGYEVVEGHAPDGAWCKAAAVADALARSSGALLVVADADVWCDGVTAALEFVAAGSPWAMPHWRVCRLDKTSSALALKAGELPPPAPTFDRAPYVGRRGGGVTVLPRATYERVPLDPRFLGWGQEDDAWAVALRAVVGREWRGLADLWHLWHEPQPRRDRFRGRGSEANVALLKEYQAAARAGRLDDVLAGARP